MEYLVIEFVGKTNIGDKANCIINWFDRKSEAITFYKEKIKYNDYVYIYCGKELL